MQGGSKQQRGQGGGMFCNRLAQARDLRVHSLDQLKQRGGGLRIRERRANKAGEQRVIAADPFDQFPGRGPGQGPLRVAL